VCVRVERERKERKKRARDREIERVCVCEGVGKRMREIRRAWRKRAGGVIPSARFLTSAVASSISVASVYTCVYLCGRRSE